MRSKERVKNVIFSVLPMQKMGAREKKGKWGEGEGKEGRKTLQTNPWNLSTRSPANVARDWLSW